MAAEARKRGLPGELPVMASLVESGLKNLNFGHADSVGFFQMRVGTWNTGAYAGYPEDPRKQLDWFLDTAEAQKRCGSRAASRSTTRRSTASGSPTSSARPSSSAAATSSSSTRRAGCSAAVGAGGRARGRRGAGRVRSGQFGAEGTAASPARRRCAARERQRRARLDRHRRPQGRPDRPAHRRRPDQAQRRPQDHRRCMCSDHSKFTTGGSVSNHHYGRGLDIAAVDGVPVNAVQLRRARDRHGAAGLRPRDPPGRDRHPVGDLRQRLLHRLRPPGPPPHRLQAADHAGLEAARRGRGCAAPVVEPSAGPATRWCSPPSSEAAAAAASGGTLSSFARSSARRLPAGGRSRATRATTRRRPQIAAWMASAGQKRRAASRSCRSWPRSSSPA